MPERAIEAIIKARKDKADNFKKRKATYEDLNKKVIEIMRLRDKMLNEDFQDPKKRKLAGEDFINALSALNSEAFDKCYEKLRDSINDVVVMYEKDEINISVIGERRQGKSQLLQSISGLTKDQLDGCDIIPTANISDDCTGAVSVIKNSKNMKDKEVKVEVEFYNEREMVEQINGYIREINDPELQEIKFYDEIKDIPARRVLAKLRQAQSVLVSKCEQLAKFVENIEVWGANVEKYGQRKEKLSVNKEDVIRYVAQHNGKPSNDPDREDYFEYLSVKEVAIICKFVYPRAGKIVLRDTVGFGDSRVVGLLDSMVQSVSKSCDAAIVVTRPDPLTAQVGGIGDTIYSALQKSAQDRKLNMGDWCFYVLNHTKAGDRFVDNIDTCDRIKGEMRRNNRACASIYTVDVSDSDEVTKELLIPMLDKLMENLPKLDKALEDRILEESVEAYNEYEKLCQQCERVKDFEEKIKEQFDDTTYKNFASRWDEGKFALEKIRKNYEKFLNKDCEEFKREVEKLRPGQAYSGGVVPNPQNIKASLNAGRGAQGLVEDYMNKLRNDFTKRFVQMDDVIAKLVADMQKEVCKVLVKTFSLDEIVGYAPPACTEETENEDVENVPSDTYAIWLGKLYDRLKEIFKESKKYDDILVAIKFLSSFTISVRGFLMHDVRAIVKQTMYADINTDPSASIQAELGRLNSQGITDDDERHTNLAEA
ncbi:MAG: hypothetical protein IKA02_00265, partial [Clostridia bacterium]|nr:hypothetical protein [Clostridia bacterium]